LRMLPVTRPEELVTMYKTGGWGRGFTSYPLYLELAKRTDLFNGVVARTGVDKVRFTPPGGRGQFTQREFVSGNYFSLLGVGSALGRLFTEDDNRVPGGHPLAVLSYDFWQNRFGADPAILGRTLLVDDQLLTVIGVAAPGFRGVEVEHHPEIWVPAMMYPANNLMNPGMWWVWIVARRRPEVTPQQVQAAVDVMMRQHLAAAYPPSYNAAFRKKAFEQRLEVRDGAVGLSMLRDEFGKPLAVLLAAVGLVLLAACVNVANLMLARGAARQKEIALRFSLGATRARLVRQALTESLLLAAAGSALGVWFASWGQRVILQFLPADSSGALSAAPDGAVLAFTLAISAASALLFGLAPAMRSTAVVPAAELRWGTARAAGGSALRRALVVAQVAFSVVLVAMAGLFGHSLFALRNVDLGFRNQNVFAFRFDFPPRQNMTKADPRLQYGQLARQLEEISGVQSASYGFPGPFQMGVSSATIRVPGSERTAGEPVDIDLALVAPRYFETIGSALVLGREFDRNDTPGGRKVAVVNETFVKQFLAGENHPDSRWMSFDDSRPEGGERTWIVGVVKDIRHAGIQKAPKPAVYVPDGQQRNNLPPTFLVRTSISPAKMLQAIYRELSRIGPAAAVWDPETLGQHVDDSIFRERLLAALGGFFGALALLLAAVGLYGVVAYGTARRAGEIGVRIALGAQRGQVVWLVLRDALLLVSLGLAIGLPASLAAAKAVSSLLFAIKPEDPVTFATTTGVLAAIGLAAAWMPARRAAGMDAMRALRHE
jgi:predicted permease